MTDPHPAPLRRLRADHRPERDPACAGCPQLGLLRALRRAGVAAEGRLSCEPGAGLLLAAAARGEARVLVVAGPQEPALDGLPFDLEPGAITRLTPDDLVATEAAVRRALAVPGLTLLLSIVPCVLGAARAAPLAVHEARCNRCGGCLALGCPAISDEGGEAMAIDPAVCTGCGRCTSLCRGHAIGPGLVVLGA